VLICMVALALLKFLNFSLKGLAPHFPLSKFKFGVFLELEIRTEFPVLNRPPDEAAPGILFVMVALVSRLLVQ